MMTTMLACPVCGGALTLAAAAATCPNTRLRSRSGYLNLLVKKQSAEPGDSVAMLQSRRAFLQAGFYDAISSAAARRWWRSRRTARMPTSPTSDAGKGSSAAEPRSPVRSPGPTCYGVDIRPGVKMATSRPEVHWVGEPAHTPFLPHSIDLVLCMLPRSIRPMCGERAMTARW
jgi:23S rRNA (guanine745-N1)-methyltransferase